MATTAAAACQQRSGGGQCIGSATAVGMAVAAVATSHCHAATVRRRGGDEDTSDNINGVGADNNQQSTKNCHGNGNGNNDSDDNGDGNEGDGGSGGSMVAVREQRPAWWQRRQLGKSAALAVVASLVAEVAAWQVCGVGGGSQLGDGGGSLARVWRWRRWLFTNFDIKVEGILVLPLGLLNCGCPVWIAKSSYFHVRWNPYR